MPLVTALDGTQTFGWTDNAAMFPKDQPLITSPPYTEIEFPLYLKPTGQAFADIVQAVVASLRQPPTPLNSRFFSRENVDVLQTALQIRIAESMHVAIDRQSDWELLLIMRRTYLESANSWPDDVDAEVVRLNTMVLQQSVDAVARNITKYLMYISKIPMTAPLLDPAEMLTSEAFATGTPAPLRNLNEPTVVPTVLWPTTQPRQA